MRTPVTRDGRPPRPARAWLRWKVYHADADVIVGARGLEPPTPRSQNRVAVVGAGGRMARRGAVMWGRRLA